MPAEEFSKIVDARENTNKSNNRRLVYIKFKIAMVSSYPSNDLAFIRLLANLDFFFNTNSIVSIIFVSPIT